SRSGNRKRLGFEGGQTPLLIRQPKLGGFNNPNRVEHEAINLSDIERLESGSYDTASLRENKIARTKKPIKILGKGKVTKKYELKVEAASKVAVEAIEKAGGKIVIG
ncbi:50S ribosomal protein L15, partial [Candidatus Peregrinibacteria bacterium]|nr:50S ribosomal protein L15 [Candidatus Peregrinibacteria bacterium]